MTMCGKETVQYGRPLRRRHEAWIYRRSTRIVPLLLRGKEKTDRTGNTSPQPSDNDNATARDAPNRYEPRNRQAALASR
ncbi:hypothetical protein J2W76_001541 [Methylorubrum zatmanii]|nr:hypothetical protein [Methylorubrum zatmanii]MCP1555089.1 hypothetical protein [Methylorubrum extorquens]MCP1578599.1 hypothetical protein [Methylorubrum extorquens]